MSITRKPFDNCPQFMTDATIEQEALICLDYYQQKTGHPHSEKYQVRAEQICEYLLDEHDFTYYLDEDIHMPKDSKYWTYTEGNEVLGYTNFTDKEVHIKQKNLSDRTAFVHETKHGIHDSRFVQPSFLAKEHERLEIQAKTFSRFFLLPKHVFVPRFYQMDNGHRDFSDVLSYLMDDFKVSGRTILIRARELNLISENIKKFLWHKKNFLKKNPHP